MNHNIYLDLGLQVNLGMNTYIEIGLLSTQKLTTTAIEYFLLPNLITPALLFQAQCALNLLPLLNPTLSSQIKAAAPLYFNSSSYPSLSSFHSVVSSPPLLSH